MKYKNDYLATRNKKEFLARLMKKYPTLKPASRERRFYECKKLLGEQFKYNYAPEDKKEPNKLRMLQFEQMKMFVGVIDRKKLRKYGFHEHEINWLEDEGKILADKYI